MDVALTTYEEALDYLFARTTGLYKFGLERTLALLGELGDPHRSVPVLHIAGTNGKGSSVATASALLRARGLRVGSYTSPHLVDFRERILVNGVPIAPDAVTAFIHDQLARVERIGASFFEATTALAFRHFADARVDVAVVETGLGGRLDSTNVVDPIAAGVTSIGYDHMEYLGLTLESIAAEKAGIFKAGRPAVIGERDEAVRGWLARDARRAGATPVRTIADEMRISDARVTPSGTEFTLEALGERREICTPLVGLHQASNFAFTLALLDAAGPPYRCTLAEAAEAVASVRLPGRFQRVGDWIFDVAHNADGARTLAGSLRALADGRDVTTLLCVLGDKDWGAMIDALAPVTSRFILTDAPTAPATRRWPLDEALERARLTGRVAVAVPSFDDAICMTGQCDGTRLVTGSFHTVGDAMTRLQLSPVTG